MANHDGRFLCCPLCQGKGQVERADLIERLSGPHNQEKLQALLEELKKQEHDDLIAVSHDGDRDAFEREVHSWPPRRILWRRSPKE